MIMLKQDTSGKTNNWTYLFNKWNHYLKLTARKTLSAAEAIFLSKNLAKLPQANLHSQLLLCMMPWFCSSEIFFNWTPFSGKAETLFTSILHDLLLLEVMVPVLLEPQLVTTMSQLSLRCCLRDLEISSSGTGLQTPTIRCLTPVMWRRLATMKIISFSHIKLFQMAVSGHHKRLVTSQHCEPSGDEMSTELWQHIMMW